MSPNNWVVCSIRLKLVCSKHWLKSMPARNQIKPKKKRWLGVYHLFTFRSVSELNSFDWQPQIHLFHYFSQQHVCSTETSRGRAKLIHLWSSYPTTGYGRISIYRFRLPIDQAESFFCQGKGSNPEKEYAALLFLTLFLGLWSHGNPENRFLTPGMSVKEMLL